MKKILLILLMVFVSIFMNGFNLSVEAKMFPPLFCETNFKVNTPASTEQEMKLIPIINKFRYADAITVISINDYLKLLNIHADSSFSNYDIQNILGDFGYTNFNFTSTNKAVSRLVYILFYQKKYKNQLNSKVLKLTEAQKKKYLSTANNLKIASALYDSAKIDLEKFIQTNNDSRKYSTLVTGLGFNNQLVNAIYQGMGEITKNTTNTNMPNNITLDMVKAKEADAIIQWTNISLGTQTNLGSKDLAEAWGTKAYAYLYKSDFTNTINCFNKAIQYSPTNTGFWSKRAFSKLSLADFNGAISDYTKAIALGSKDVYDYYNRACAKVLIGQNVSAANDFKKVSQMALYSSKPELVALAMTYNQALSQSDGGNSEFIKNKIFLENPVMMKNYMKKNGTMPIANTNKGSSSQMEVNNNMQNNNQQKSVIPVGCRVYLIIGRLKNSHTEVRYTTIAQITKIEDIVNADTRFEWVRYETVPDSYLDRYPRY